MKARLSVVSCQLSVASIALLLCFCLPISADDFGDIRVQIENLSPGSREHGYVEYRATVTNRSPQQTHRVTLEFPSVLYGVGGHVMRSLTRTIEVAPNATVTVSLFCPALEISGSGVAVTIDGLLQQLELSFSQSQVAEGRYDYDGHLLISPAVKQSGLMLQAESLLTYPRGEKRFDFVALEAGLNEWSRNWLGYSSYDGVIVTGAELRAAAEPVRTALLQYVECGGTLLVMGDWEVPAQWKATRKTTTWQEAYSPAPTPSAEAAAVPTPTPTPTPTPEPIAVRNDLQQYEVGFGVVMIMGEQAKLAMTTAQWQFVRGHWETTRHTFRNDTNGWNAVNGNRFAVVEGLTTPVRGLFVLMLFFVIVIGPLNLWLLSRWRKRLWLLWTVPAISLLTCLTVAGYAILREGIQGYERIEAFTLLDETTRRATTIGYLGFYAPLTPGEGLHFSVNTELTPITADSYYYQRNGSSRRALDWSNDQHLTSGWVTARTPTYLLLRKSETRRERLTITANQNGTYTIVNGLGARVEQLWFADAQSKLHSGSSIEAGASQQLKATDRILTIDSSKPYRFSFGTNWLPVIEDLPDTPEQPLRAGHYLAVMEAAPFIETGLDNIRSRRAKTVVYGLPAQP